jgi:hypothetical protein
MYKPNHVGGGLSGAEPPMNEIVERQKIAPERNDAAKCNR